MKTNSKIKKIFGLLLMLCMVMGLMPIAALADNPVILNKIEKVTITGMIMPVIDKPCIPEGVTITTYPADAVEIESILWHDYTWGAIVGGDDTFNGEHAYYISIRLKPKEGYYFEFNNAAADKFNTYTGKVSLNSKHVRRAYEVNSDSVLYITSNAIMPGTVGGTKWPTEISAVDFSGINLPTAGGTPDYEGDVPETAQYHFADDFEIEQLGFNASYYNIKNVKNGIYWMKKPTDCIKETDTFEVGEQYRVFAILVPNEGYTFAIANESTPSFNGRVDLVSGNQTDSYGTYMIIESIDFDPIEPIFFTAVNSSTSALNVRSTPDVADNRIGGVVKNEVIGVLETVESGGLDWYKIVYGPENGYVQVQYTDGEPSTSTVLVSSLNVREEADASAKRIGGLIKGQEVKVLDLIDTDGDPATFEWARIIYGNTVAYVMAPYIGFGGVGGGEAEYSIISGDNQTYSGSGDISVKADGDLIFFDHLEMDGDVIDESDYTAISGSTEVTLKESYLQTLSPGEHALKFVYVDGDVTAVLSIAEQSDTEPGAGTEQSITIPIRKIVVQGGNKAPDSAAFNFELVPYGNSDADLSGITITGNSIKTNGKGEYEGTITLSGDIEKIRDCEGIKLTEKKENLEKWTYDDTVYIIWPDYDRTGISATIQKDMGPDMNPENVETAVFTNTYTANETAATSSDTAKKDSPKTGDSSNMILWIALLGAACGGAAAVIIVKKKKANSK